MSILLAVDIGNSTTGFGIFPNPVKTTRLLIKKIPTYPVRSKEAYKEVIIKLIEDCDKGRITKGKGQEKTDAIISSVVPSADRPIIEAIEETCGRRPIIVSHKISCGIAFNIKRPEKIGADRIANAVGGLSYYKGPFAVVDMGTATTITVVCPWEYRDGSGTRYTRPTILGGAIMPGMDLMRQALIRGTAKLPPVSLKRPETVLGGETASSIRSGIINGTIGAVEALIKGIEKELCLRLKLVLTGGHAKLVSTLLKREHCLAPNLTFEGLRSIYTYVRHCSKNLSDVEDLSG